MNTLRVHSRERPPVAGSASRLTRRATLLEEKLGSSDMTRKGAQNKIKMNISRKSLSTMQTLPYFFPLEQPYLKLHVHDRLT